MNSDAARAKVLSRIRAALGVTPQHTGREDEVRRRLEAHPRGTIPDRACQDRVASVALFKAMLVSQGAEDEVVGQRGKRAKVDYAKLLGFDSVSERISGRVDFQDDAIGAKLGAKVGNETGQGELRVSSAPRI